MRAFIHTKFGPPEVLRLEDVDKPAPGAGDVLIRVHATTVSAEDPGMRASRGLNGLIRPKKQILGMYLAGTIEAIGPEVKRFSEGETVYGSAGMQLGAYAEYICLPEHAALAGMPSGVTFEQAAALPNGGLTALPFLREKANIAPGCRVLVNGASGTVGSMAVQIAESFGAEVIGVCSTENVERVRGLGAAEVIDYTQTDFSREGVHYDVIFDVAGKRTFTDVRKALAPTGIYLTTGFSPEVLLRMRRKQSEHQQQAYFMATGLRDAKDKAADLEFINKLVEGGSVRPVIDRVFPFEQLADAHRYVEAGRKKGDVVVKWV